MIHVGHLAPRGCWDENMVNLLLTNELYDTGLPFTHHDGYPNTDDGCVLIIPGRYWYEQTADITAAVARYPWVLGFRTADEEDLFTTADVTHPNIRWWVQTPRTDTPHDGARLFGCGWTPHFNDLPAEPPRKDADVFLSAQRTTPRRRATFDALAKASSATTYMRATLGFTQGMNPADYAEHMCGAKVAPAPSGPATPDTFRVYEALQAHTIPIADDITDGYPSNGYWRSLFPDAPFPILTDLNQWPGYVHDSIADWPALANRVTAWWMSMKRRYMLWLREDLHTVGAI